MNIINVEHLYKIYGEKIILTMRHSEFKKEIKSGS